MFHVDVINLSFHAHSTNYDEEEVDDDEIVNEYFNPNSPHFDDSIYSTLLFLDDFIQLLCFSEHN